MTPSQNKRLQVKNLDYQTKESTKESRKKTTTKSLTKYLNSQKQKPPNLKMEASDQKLSTKGMKVSSTMRGKKTIDAFSPRPLKSTNKGIYYPETIDISNSASVMKVKSQVKPASKSFLSPRQKASG